MQTTRLDRGGRMTLVSKSRSTREISRWLSARVGHCPRRTFPLRSFRDAMKPTTVRHHCQASAARMFMLFFGGLVLAGLLLLAMTAVVKTKTTPPGKQPVAGTNSTR
jgi:hypothetical protein